MSMDIGPLAVIASDLGVPVGSFKVERGAVFYDAADGLRCVCQLDTPYWHECQARAEYANLIARLSWSGRPPAP